MVSTLKEAEKFSKTINPVVYTMMALTAIFFMIAFATASLRVFIFASCLGYFTILFAMLAVTNKLLRYILKVKK